MREELTSFIEASDRPVLKLFMETFTRLREESRDYMQIDSNVFMVKTYHHGIGIVNERTGTAVYLSPNELNEFIDAI